MTKIEWEWSRERKSEGKLHQEWEWDDTGRTNRPSKSQSQSVDANAVLCFNKTWPAHLERTSNTAWHPSGLLTRLRPVRPTLFTFCAGPYSPCSLALQLQQSSCAGPQGPPPAPPVNQGPLPNSERIQTLAACWEFQIGTGRCCRHAEKGKADVCWRQGSLSGPRRAEAQEAAQVKRRRGLQQVAGPVCCLCEGIQEAFFQNLISNSSLWWSAIYFCTAEDVSGWSQRSCGLFHRWHF